MVAVARSQRSGPCLARGPEHGRTPAAHGPQPRHGRVRRPADRHRTPDRSVRLPGDGTQRWPAVHALDAAALARLALEQAEAGTSWHAVADEGDQVRDIAAAIGRRLGLPVESVPSQTYGPLGPIFANDQPSSSAHTRQTLGWEPKHPSFLEDLENIQP
ncbi:hypothetical protein NKH18_37860 [Streptomyces sp. M10(2022)]